jgi:ferredoxin
MKAFIEIRHRQKDCIGCARCYELAPDYWKMNSQGLAELKVIQNRKEPFRLARAFKEDRLRLEQASHDCPVGIIDLH